MTFDVKIATASASNTTSKLNAWRPLAAERPQISKIGRRILVALVEFHKGIYAVYAVLTIRRKYLRSKNGRNRRTWCGNKIALSYRQTDRQTDLRALI